MEEPIYTGNQTHVRNMSKRQRRVWLNDIITISPDLAKYVKEHTTNRVKYFVAAMDGMIAGDVVWHPLGLFHMAQDVDFERRWRFGN